MSQMSQSDEGNTKTSSQLSSSNRNRSRKWIGTLNNYDSKEMSQMSQDFIKFCEAYIIGEEVGESGTPHLQIYVEFKNQVDFSRLKKDYPRVHWEKARGTREQNRTYCSKDGVFTEKNMIGFKQSVIMRALASYDNVVWRPWQINIIRLLEEKPNDRTIIWAWEPTGNVGKSFLAKWLVIKHKAIIADGKKDNVFNQVFASLENEIEPYLIILDIPRHNIDYVNYGVLESLKNGMIYSGKYEGGVCIFPNPHVLVFANTPPDRGRMSDDRWLVLDI